MRFIIVFFILASLCSSIRADDIYLKNGKKFINVTITDSTDQYYSIKFTTRTSTRIPKEDVLKILYKPLDGQSSLDEANFVSTSKVPNKRSVYSVEYPNDFLAPIAILSLALGYDYFKEANDIQKTIDAARKLNSRTNTSDLESAKTRKTIIGVTCIAAGVLTAIFSLKTVEVSADPSQVQVNYRYNF